MVAQLIKAHYHVHRSSPLDLIVSKLNSALILRVRRGCLGHPNHFPQCADKFSQLYCTVLSAVSTSFSYPATHMFEGMWLQLAFAV